MATPTKNFGLVTVSGLYNASATTVTLQSGEGGKLPATTGGYRYPLTWWDAGTFAHPADDPFAEIVLVTNKAGDVLTVVRGQEGITAQTKNTPGAVYRMSLGVTKAMWDELFQNKNSHLGLVLQTHRDSDLAQSRVELVACEQLVMGDGTISRNDGNEWTGKTANITVSGAGGLDTGTEEASTWYEVWGIAKEDGTRNLILHKSKKWIIDANHTTEDASQPIRSTTSNAWVTQGVQFAGGKVVYFDAKLERINNPTGYIYCVIYADSAGLPGTFVVQSHKLDVSRIPGAATWVRFTFPAHLMPTLSASPARYHFGVSGSWAINGVDYVNWRMDGSAGVYAGGSKSTYNGTVWTADADDDMTFFVGVEQNVAALVLPTDYTKSCFLGWVYNDASSNFGPFLQQGRSRRSTRLGAGDVVEVLNGTVEIISPNIPPFDLLTVRLGCTGTGTQVGVVAVGDGRSMDISNTGDTVGAQALLVSPLTSTKPGVFTDVLVERGFFLAQGTNGAQLVVAGFSW